MSLSIEPVEPDECEKRVPFGGVGRDVAPLRQLGHERGPFAPQGVRSGERPVSADADEGVYPSFEEIPGGRPSPLPAEERGAARRPDDRAAEVENAADGGPAQRADPVSAVDEALEPVRDGERDRFAGERRPYRRTDDGVHSGGIPAAGEDREPALAHSYAVFAWGGGVVAGFGGGGAGIRLIASPRLARSGRSVNPEGSNSPAFRFGLSP